MLYLSLRLSNPFVTDYNNNNWDWDWKLSEYKHLSIQIDKPDWKRLFDFSFHVRDSSYDHKGVQFESGTIFGGLNIDLYDSRHVDDYE